MAEESSSSSSYSSDSLDSSSSSSLSSKSLSSNSSSSSYSSESTSSSSIDSSSSSSSSKWEKTFEKLLPFMYSVKESLSVGQFGFYQSRCFAVCGKSILSSLSRYQWEEYFSCDDAAISSLLIKDNIMYLGTKPNGKLYKIDMLTKETELLFTFGYEIGSIFRFKNLTYVAEKHPFRLYALDESSVTRIKVYELQYKLTNVLFYNSLAYFVFEDKNIVFFDGQDFTPLFQASNVSSMYPANKDIFAYTEFDCSNEYSGLEFNFVAKKYNIGLTAATVWNDRLICGGNNGRIFEFNLLNSSFGIIFETDSRPAQAIFALDFKSLLVSIGEKVYLANKREDNAPWRFVPVLELEDESVVSMELDPELNQILLGTSAGRILSVDSLKLNAYATGERNVWAYSVNQYGNKSFTESTNFMYGLYRNILTLSKEKEIDSFIFRRDASILSIGEQKGVFLSEIMEVKEDLGIWKTLIWEENAANNGKIKVFVRFANDINSLYSEKWSKSFSSIDGESGLISRDLTSGSFSGKVAQIKIELISTIDNINDFVSYVQLVYTTKNASYFYTNKFTLDKDAGSKKGIIVANVSTPLNTEVQFAIGDSQASTWRDFTGVPTGTIFDMPTGSDIKIGIKFTSYEQTLPQVSEFAIMTVADKTSKINQLN